MDKSRPDNLEPLDDFDDAPALEKPLERHVGALQRLPKANTLAELKAIQAKYPLAHPRMLAEQLVLSMAGYPSHSQQGSMPIPLHVNVTPETVRWLREVVDTLCS